MFYLQPHFFLRHLLKAGCSVLSLVFVLTADAQNKSVSLRTTSKEPAPVSVYTTAQNTSYRLSPMETLQWKTPDPLVE
ncbi:MAG TPA: hypothetical protein VFL47_04805, partial [Flavisolibacter sp.]|nr:hypothetical protein [Flavisolibacter sp.]